MAAAVTNQRKDWKRLLPGTDMAMPTAIVGILALMILPLPPLLLDILIAINITLALMMLLTSIQVRNALEFSVLPSLLLMTTLFRLGLNVASTRLILLDGGTGSEAAGQIIETFGVFIVGGNYAVGIVIFLILMLINFIVITKGAGRIAEVTARFTLDSLPGKQMSIDSDLASGLLDTDEARKKRQELSRETDFYGAMDGASKFVRGDAIAGLVITAINLIGGLFVGMVQLDLSFTDAATVYTILTIGDALVSQVPALLISTASGMVITRVSDERELGAQVGGQMFNNPKVLYAGAGIMGALALVPNMPLFPFAMVIGGLVYIGRKVTKEGEEPKKKDAKKTAKADLSEDEQLERMLPVETLELEVGYALVKLVDNREGGEIVKRISGLRRNFAKDMGIILPPVHVRDNLELNPGEYRLMIQGVEMARGSVMPDRIMAMDPGDAREKLEGIKTTEPAFGLPALWIRATQKAKAEVAGYTVVEPATVVVTHISDVLNREAHQLIDREGLQKLLEVVARRSPKIVEELIPAMMSHAEVLAVLRSLLKEGIGIRDMRSILEALTEAAPKSKSIPYIVDRVRMRLGPSIIQELVSPDGKIYVGIFDSQSEETLRSFVSRTDTEVALAPDLTTAQNLVTQLQRVMQNHQGEGRAPVIIVPPDLRYAIQHFALRFVAGLFVVSQREIPPRVDVTSNLSLSLYQGRTAQTKGGSNRPNQMSA